jgi:tetratricopeptide (TPR) repeat protein
VNGKQDLSSDDRHHLDAAQGWTGLGNFDEAMAELDQIDRAGQSHLDVLHVRWVACMLAGRWEKCLRIARKIVRSWPDDQLAPVQVAVSLSTLGRPREALPILEEAVERFGENVVSAMSLAYCYSKLGESDLARQFADRARELWSD